MNSNEYMRKYMLKRYHRRRKDAIEKLGGVCTVCGISEQLEFHHKVRRGDSDLVVTKYLPGMAEKRLKAELKKCVLLCRECHKDQTYKELGFTRAKGTHGTLSAYTHCGPPKCEECKKAKRDWTREYRKTHKRKK